MATRDYHPYSPYTCTRAPKRRPILRVDSTQSPSPSPFSPETERKAALQQLLLRYQQSSDEEESDDGTLVSRAESASESETLIDEGSLGLRARDSIDINVGRSGTWESRECRGGRWRRSRMRMVKNWLVRRFCFRRGSNGYLVTV